MLLDAAIVMMQQYSTTVPFSQHHMTPPPNTSATSPSSSNVFPANGRNTTTPTEFPKIAKVAPTTTAQVSSANESTDEVKPSTSQESNVSETNVVTPEEEIRKRRLQRFQLGTTTTEANH